MSITPFRPFIKMSDYNLIKTFWIKVGAYNRSDNSENFKKELNEIIKELKYRDLRLSETEFLNKILF